MYDYGVIKRAESLCDFLNKGVSVYHIVENLGKILKTKNFIEIDYGDVWNISENFKGFLKFQNSSLFAFNINKKDLFKGFKIICSHLDSPCLKIKSGSDVLNSDGSLYLNVETYGGAILNTWLDRGLSIAGRVFLKENNDSKIFQKLLDFEEEICFIPNCPIHLNRDINSGFALNKQRHMMPILFFDYFSEVKSLREMISKKLKVREENILDFDLYLYDPQLAKIIGFNKEFVQSKKIDDLAMVESSLYSFINSSSNGNRILCVYDGEEIGSSISQGASSNCFLNILNRIFDSLNISNEERNICIHNSFLISADMAHTYNSNYSEKFDEYNKCLINKGVVIKNNSNKNYVTSGESSAYFKLICEKANVPYQIYFNRSDILGGSTLGPIFTKYVPIKGVDVGNPMFAMHSCRETCGVLDHYYITKVFEEFFK